ncbi:hypothetical protein L873DRAFT_1786829 [Choiromyces venosus 120613-1]|uniref:Uncharacterized protein n=1 Tax=Choiromyces venosus 120613-1 TaxID=1336337 RepID=A0A3N4K602_9PEZI|nr:hypothetical protein L873DRAFT_1786829 [Choiromyces venosus 120613-1]
MAYNYNGGDYEVSSRNNIQLNRLNHPYTSVDTSESQISLKSEVDLATDLNDHSRNKPWRPFTLRAPTIMGSLLITVALIVFIEYINKISRDEKALFFAEKDEDFSTAVVFCYRYLPQMIVVALGVGWAAVDLDVKRLEPYYQLSKPEGATASNSIFLHYPFDFMAFVPVNAARKRHWNVFWAGLALCLIFWVITPLNSSLLTTQAVTRDIETAFKPFQQLTPFDGQKLAMSASFLYTSYGVTWLGEKVHSFMTKGLIAIPFKPASYGEGQDRLTRGKEYWTAQTRVYQTELSCTPAEVTSEKGPSLNFKTDKCEYSIDPISNPNATRRIMYIGFANDDGVGDYYLTKAKCKDPNLFLAIWAKSQNAHNRSDELDLNALYCKPSYHYQTYEVTVDATDCSITKADPVGERTNFTQADKIINIIMFEGNVGAAATISRANAKYFASESPNSMARFEDWDIDNPTGQISYVIGLSPTKKFDDFKDPETFRNALERMHKLLFNNALQTLLVPDSSGQEVIGNRVVKSVGVVVIPLIAHVLAGFLGAVVICLAGVFVVSYRRQNNLASDPDTLGTKMALVAHSETLLRDFDGSDECPAPHLCMEPRKYKLGIWGGEYGYRLDVMGGRDNPPVQNPHASCAVTHDGKLVGPIELSLWTGLSAAVVNIALLTLLIVLYRSALQYNDHSNFLLTSQLGLPTLSDKQLVTQIIFSFVPTVIATLLEPFWVLVGRYLALYQPYTELYRGNASPDSSLGLKYTNIPPVLIAPRALRHGHIILFLASMMVIAANFLAVALGGIFDQGFKPLMSDLVVNYPFTTSINTDIQMTKPSQGAAAGTFARDSTEHWLVVNTNVIEGTELPAWVTDEFYFLPFEWDKPENKSDLRTSITQGYGGNLTCHLLNGDTFKQSVRLDRMTGTVGTPRIGINVTIPISDGSSVRCGGNNTVDVQLLESGTHPYAAEWVWGLKAVNRDDQKAVQACSTLILAGWGRGDATQVRDENDLLGIHSTTSATMSSNTTIICSQQISTGEFEVTVDVEGRVKRSKLIGELKYNDPGIFNRSTTVSNFTAQLATLFRAPPRKGLDFGILHNDNSSHSFSQFIGEYLINKTLSDPATPSPNFNDAQHALSKFYKRFVTILLAQNQNRIFVPAEKVRRTAVGQLESLRPRMSMDPVMFYIAVVILGFQLIAGSIIFASRPRRFLPRFPYNLVSEISFFHASSAMSDVAGTANMSSAMRSRHLRHLGWSYGYGKFRGSDGKKHVGIERMSLIRDYKESTSGWE